MSKMPKFAPVEDKKSPSDVFLPKIKPGETIEFVCLTGVKPPVGEEQTTKNSVIDFYEYTMWKEGLGPGEYSPRFPMLSEGKPGESGTLEGHEDPGKVLGLDPVMRGMMLVAPSEKGKPTGEEKIYSFGISIYKQLLKIEDGLEESLKGKVLRVSRTGSGRTDTRYMVMATGKSVEVTGEPELDMIDYVGPTTYDEIIDLLVRTGNWKKQEEKSEPKKKSPFAKAGDEEFKYSEDE